MEHNYSLSFRVERAYSNLKDAIESLLLESTSANQCLTINVFKCNLLQSINGTLLALYALYYKNTVRTMCLHYHTLHS